MENTRGILKQFYILMKKNMILRKRHYIITGIEFLIPILLGILFIYLGAISINEKHVRQKTFSSQSIEKHIEKISQMYISEDIFGYAPNDDKIKAIIKDLENIGRNKSINIEYQGFKSEKELIDEYKRNSIREAESSRYVKKIRLAVIFNSINSNEFKYTIRPSQLNGYTAYGEHGIYVTDSSDYTAFNQRALFLQYYLDKLYMKMQAKTSTQKQTLGNFQAYMQKLPIPDYYYDQLPYMAPFILTIMLSCLLVGFSASITLRIIQEKTSGMRELLRTMGLRNWVNYVTWFINGFIFLFFVNCFILLYVSVSRNKFPPLFKHTNKFLLFLILNMYSTTTILFCICITVFFQRAVFGIMLCIIIQVATAAVPAFTLDGANDIKYTSESAPLKMFTCLVPNINLYWTFRLMTHLEHKGIGAHWDNLSEGILKNDPFHLSKIMWMTVASWFVQIFIIWYFDACWPWQAGVPKPFYFPFMKSYWFPHKDNVDMDISENQGNKEYFEFTPTGETAGIEIRNLSKNFSGKTVVDGISLDLLKGQITALLGHNGAGKTTTMSIITGMFPPTNGTVFVNGYDVRKNLNAARRSMGYCPQESAFINELTVAEHLELIGTLKGYPSAKMQNEINKIISQVNLTEKKNAVATALSGGMKRKLSLAMALIGETKVLLLDEPTAGLDPEARKEVWNILQAIRSDRTILLTTHYMEEADALGDRIAIMHEGLVYCVGSAMFLKNKFGAGYHLRMVKKDGFNTEAVTNYINDYFPVNIERDSGREFSLIIEFQSVEKFPAFFKKFESDLSKLNIESFAVSVTNMEDVFLKVGEMASMDVDNQTSSNGLELEDRPKRTNRSDSVVLRAFSSGDEVSGPSLFLMQLIGLLLKRFHHNKRQVFSFIVQIVFPLLMVGAILALAKLFALQSEPNKSTMNMKLDIYGNTKVLLKQNDNDLAKKYTELINQEHGDIVASKNITKSALDAAKVKVYDYLREYPIAAEINKATNNVVKLTVLKNTQATFGGVISLNVIDNLQLRAINSKSTIEVNIHKLPVLDTFSSTYYLSFILMIMVPMAIVFMSSVCALFLIKEKVSKSKHLQLMTGLHPIVFWLAHMLWDFVICSLISLICCAMLLGGTYIGENKPSRGAVVVLFLLYNWAAVPFTYVFTLLIKQPTVGFVIPSALSILISAIVGPLYIMTEIGSQTSGLVSACKNMDYIFRIIPAYSLGRGVAGIAKKAGLHVNCPQFRKYCSTISPMSQYRVCCEASKFDPFGMGKKESGQEMIYLLCAGFLYWLIIIFAQSRLSRFIRRSFTNLTVTDDPSMDSTSAVDYDVLEEQKAIADQSINTLGSHAVIVQNLRKRYRTCLAVADVSFKVMKEECFGLLGINGAGKTTTFSMLTGDLDMTSGNALSYPYTVKNNLSQFQSRIGYCPQFNAHLELLTGREMLFLFARLRGISTGNTKAYVQTLIEFVDLSKHADKKCGIYSGGNKRKLSIALAIMGMPPLIFLDEPTAGIDPVARRQIWELLTTIKSSGTSVVLTSHSMEECEALCDRLTIMVRGRLQCIGSVVHLKDKFGQGYTIYANMKLLRDGHDENRKLKITQTIQAKIPSLVMKNQNLGVLTFHVADVQESWAHMFEVMESIQKEFDLENYAISATTLEEVFLSFAKV